MAERDSLQENLVELESIKELISIIPNNGQATAWIESVRLLPRASALPPHYDPEVVKAITDRLELHPAEGASYKQAIKDLRRARTQARNEQKKKAKEKSPTRALYFQLFQEVLGEMKRDIFSGKLMLQYGGMWEPARNHLGRVYSEAHDYRTEDIDFVIGAIEPHFDQYEHEQTPVFIPEIPVWDGIDRLQQIAACIELDGTQNIPSNSPEVFLKLWCAGIFRKMDDPGYQNPVLILKGPQGIGKDVLIDTVTGGFGQWARDLILSNNDKDNYSQLSRSAVLKIAEFERTSRTDISTLKDMIFRKYTYLRGAYERDFKEAQCRASFVASCNTEDIYRDSTGNRRFVVLNIKSIDWKYEKTRAAMSQILSQCKVLAGSNYDAPQMHKDAMAGFLTEKTPESLESITAETWNFEVNKYLESLSPASDIRKGIEKRGWISNRESMHAELFRSVSRSVSLPERVVRQHLKTLNMGVKERVDGDWNRGFSFDLRQVRQVRDTFETDVFGDEIF